MKQRIEREDVGGEGIMTIEMSEVVYGNNSITGAWEYYNIFEAQSI